MERRLAGLFLVALSIGTGACLVVDTDDVGGGTISDGGSTPIGGSTSEGGSVGNGGAPPAECDSNPDCPVPEFECTDACYDTAADQCFEQFSAEGSLCSAGICDSEGFCVECLNDNDCAATGGTCDTTSGTCIDETATGVCADSFCSGLPANNDCAACLISENQNACSAEWSACAGTGTQSGCTTCNEAITMGENQGFCAGSQVILQDYVDCICSAAACLD